MKREVLKRNEGLEVLGRYVTLRQLLVAVVVAVAAALALVPGVALAAVPPKTGTLTVMGAVSGQQFHAYRVAEMAEDGTLSNVPACDKALESLGYSADDPAMSPETFDSSTSADTLRTAAETLSGCVAQDPSGFSEKDVTASGTQASFSGLARGLYLVVADQITVGGITYTASPILVSVPQTVQSREAGQAVGSWQTDVSVAAKMAKEERPSDRFRVTKLWKDTRTKRPESVHIQIMDGTELYKEVTLDASNSWSFSWEGAGDWSVREVDVPEGYASSVSRIQDSNDASKTTGFEITNTEKSPKETPKEGVADMSDTNSLVLMLLLLVGGCALIAAGVAVSRKEHGRP
jgi:hypothetical protein